MNLLGTLVFFGWVPAIFGLFLTMPARRAVIVSYLIGWLFIPPASFELPGIPDYTKTTSTTLGVLLAALLTDSRSFLVLRPRLCDLPMLAWCIAPFCSSISNGLGAYDGMSESLNQVFLWGFPYVVGRAYMGTLTALREMALAITISGLIQVPLCLYELRMTPRLMQDFFGIGNWEGSLRFGAYRPRAFMYNGLSLGMWMTVSSLVGYWLWSTGVLKRLRGYPFGWWLLALVVTTVLCRSTGALLLLLVGGVALRVATRLARGRVLIWAMIAVVPLYCGTRTLGLWTGEGAVRLAGDVLGRDRAQSLEYRLFNEDVLADRAMTQPIFGWGGWDRMRTWNYKTDHITIPDGLWIIALGQNGLFGLTSLLLVLLVPPTLMLARYPIRSWRDPAIAPAGVLSMVCLIATIDDLSNAQIIPIYTLFGAGLATLEIPGLRPRSKARPAVAAVTRCGDPRAAIADDHARRADELLARGQGEQARVACRQALDLREAIVSESEDPSAARDLACQHEQHARILSGLGRRDEAATARHRAAHIWSTRIAAAPDDLAARRRLAECRNDQAWARFEDPNGGPAELADAIRWSIQAVNLEPGESAFWNTLGAVHYRAGNWDAAVEALQKSAALAPCPGPFDLFLMAMAVARRGDRGHAVELLARADAAARGEATARPGLDRLRAEAEGVVGRVHA